VRAGKGKAAGAGLLTRGGPSGEKAGSARGENKLGLGLLWAGIWGWLGWVSFPFLFFFIPNSNKYN